MVHIIMFQSMMEKNAHVFHEDRRRKRQIIDTSDDEKEEEVRKRKNREKCKRYREKKKNKISALPISGSSDVEEIKKEEERKRKNREKTRRHREKKKNGIEISLSMASADSSSDSSVIKMSSSNAEYCRNYRIRKKMMNANEVKNKKVSTRKSNAEKCRTYRLRKKLLAHQSSTTENLHSPSTSNLHSTFGRLSQPNTTVNIQITSRGSQSEEIPESKAICQENICIKTEFFPLKKEDQNPMDLEHLESKPINIKVENEFDDQFETEEYPYELPVTNMLILTKQEPIDF